MSETKREYWNKLISEQAASGQAVRPFCRERGLGEHSFYQWRKRLQENGAVRFAVLETKPISASMAHTLELVLASGERLCIGNGVDATRLRLALDIVRR